MTRHFIVRPVARAEIDHAIDWYAARSDAAARRFADAVVAALAAIRTDPMRYPLVDQGKRRYNLNSFPYGLYFTADEHEVIVLSCFHGRRNPARWKRRR
jgi:plasmid stabilization system protein ParE